MTEPLRLVDQLQEPPVHRTIGQVRKVFIQTSRLGHDYARIVLGGQRHAFYDFDEPEQWHRMGRGTEVGIEWEESSPNVSTGRVFRRVLDWYFISDAPEV